MTPVNLFHSPIYLSKVQSPFKIQRLEITHEKVKLQELAYNLGGSCMIICTDIAANFPLQPVIRVSVRRHVAMFLFRSRLAIRVFSRNPVSMLAPTNRLIL